MKLTVLVDNNTLIEGYYLGEPGASYFIEDDGVRILFDAGYSDVLVENARRMSIDLLDLDCVALSHGHLDHTWGLVPLVRMHTERRFACRPVRRPTLVAHPEALSPRRHDDVGEIGSLLSAEELSRFFELRLTAEPVRLTERLTFLGAIPRTNDFEGRSPLGEVERDGEMRPDLIEDDSALAYESAEGLVVITGCSHSGICNIVEHAKAVCGVDHVHDIVGGFHLLDPSEAKLAGTLAYLEALRPAAVHACHCTDLRSKIALAGVAPLQEVGVGLRLEYGA